MLELHLFFKFIIVYQIFSANKLQWILKILTLWKREATHFEKIGGFSPQMIIHKQIYYIKYC